MTSCALLALGGCLAIPHLDQLSPFVTGRVVDARTDQAVADARVEWVEYPSLAVFTDANGGFVLRETRKPELFVPLAETDALNLGARVAPRLRITREGFEPVEIDAAKPETWAQPTAGEGRTPYQISHGPFFLRPIPLRPVENKTAQAN